MRFSTFFVAVALVAAACSSPRPTPKRTDAVLSGEETAKLAGDAAKKAEKDGNTGVIIASSEADEPTSQPSAEPAPAPEPPTLAITFVKGTVTMSGEPVVDFSRVAADAAKADPSTALIIEADAETPYADVVALMDQAKAAGITRIELRQTSKQPDDESNDAASP